MLSRLVVLTLFSGFMAIETQAATDAELEALAEMFSPILILTKDTQSDYGEDGYPRVLKPEPVEIMGAESADNIWFDVFSLSKKLEASGRLSSLIESGVLDEDDIRRNQNIWFSAPNKVDLLGNKFAFFDSPNPPVWTYKILGDSQGSLGVGEYLVKMYLDYPGETPAQWDSTYFGKGDKRDDPQRGSIFSNTAYVHIYNRTIANYGTTPVTVIQYHYFYPYNDWWNNHEGDWQRIDVVVSSDDPNTATALGVEYRFHKVWVNYYKNYEENGETRPGLTESFVFDPRNSLKLSPGPTRNATVQYTHPVVYVGAGSHAGYPTGGRVEIFNELEAIFDPSEEVSGAVLYAKHEYMTHTGLVLSTQKPKSDTSHSDLWERYRLVMLPEPVLSNTTNMGLESDMSWLGARIRWGTPEVESTLISEWKDGNKSPEKGPYNSTHDPSVSISKGWGDLTLSNVGEAASRRGRASGRSMLR